MKRISEIMDRKLVAVSHNASMKVALRLAKISGVDMLPVLKNDRLVGTVNVDEVQRYVSKDQAREAETVRKLSKRPVFLEAGESTQSAIGKTIKSGLSRMPVVENTSTMRCIGTVNATDLLKATAKGLGKKRHQ
jgi:CBS domain-containing protein